MSTRVLRIWILINVIFLAACSGLNPAFDRVEAFASTLEVYRGSIPAATVTGTAQLEPTTTVTPFPAFTNTPTRRAVPSGPTRTPVPLAMFQTNRLIPQAEPTSYMDKCSYLANRWDDSKSAPGTVVVAVMYHQVVASAWAVTNPNQVAAADFLAGLAYAKKLGFESITAGQMADFLETNAAIPVRSVLLIIDDLETHAIKDQYAAALAEYGFDATLAYIAGQQDANEWKQVEDLLASGRYDIQAHGYLHNGNTYIYPNTPEQTLVEEIFTPLEILKRHSGKKPVALIWPGGDYTPHAVDLAAEAGYRLGFTVRNRGPVMFNWIPQGSDEKTTRYPLLVLPRAWSKDVISSLDQAVEISNEAQAFADAQREIEINWYMQYCKN